MYYGQGFTHSDVYEMPIYLRNFYYQELIDSKKQENDNIKKHTQKAQQKSRISKPMINPRFKR